MFMKTKGSLFPPRGWAQFMRTSKHKFNGVTPVRYHSEHDEDFMIDVASINSHVNSIVEYINDTEDTWESAFDQLTRNKPYGDCEDIAIAKRDELKKRLNLPYGCMSLALCRTEKGDDHAVLVLATTYEDYVLDNRYDSVCPWHRFTDYEWIAKEIPGSYFWKRITNV